MEFREGSFAGGGKEREDILLILIGVALLHIFINPPRNIGM